MRLVSVIALCLLVLTGTAEAARMQLGLADQPGGAAATRKAAPFGYRYQYLAGGVNTGVGWSTWNEHGTFVTRYVADLRQAHMTPVFTYYMIRQSRPGAESGDDAKADIANVRNQSTMRAYWRDL